MRYFLSFPNFFSRQRQILSLCLGTCTTLCFAVLASSLLLAVLNPSSHDDPSSAIEYTRGRILPYLASFLLVAPAVVNLVLVILWRTSNDPQTTLRGRCHWDIDVVWSGIGLSCDRSPSFASWLGGAVSRLCITGVVLVRPSDNLIDRICSFLTRLCCAGTSSAPFQVIFHVVLHRYRIVCQDAEIIDRGPYTRFPKSTYMGRRKSVTTAGSGGTRTSRPQSFTDRLEPISPPPNARTHTELTHRPQLSINDESARMITRTHSFDGTGIPAGVGSSSSSRPWLHTTGAGTSPSLHEDSDLHNFVDRFRCMVHQAARDTEEGLAYTSPESSEGDERIYSDDDQHDFNPYAEENLVRDTNGRPIEVSVDPSQVQVLGRVVHRMPTITSVGSGERSSRAPSRAYSSHHPLPGERSLTSSRSGTAENDVAGQLLSRQGIH